LIHQPHFFSLTINEPVSYIEFILTPPMLL